MSRKKGRPTLVKGKPGPRRFEMEVGAELNDCYAPFDMLTGDITHIEETSDIRPGEVFMWTCNCEDCPARDSEREDGDGRPYYWVSRLVKFNASGFTCLRASGETRRVHMSRVQSLFRIVAITRDGIRRETRREVSPKVVDISHWRQSHPRPIRNLLFAEKR